MRSTARRFTDDSGVRQTEQVFGEAFASRERPLAGQDIDLLAEVARAGNPRRCPVLPARIVRPEVRGRDENGISLGHEVREYEVDGVGRAARAMAKVDDQGVGRLQELQGMLRQVAGGLRVVEGAPCDQTDVPGEARDGVEAVAVARRL